MIPQLPKVSRDMELPDLANLVAILIKELTWLMNGHIDAKNIQANSITTKTLKAGAVTADKIDVNQLSAISANLGYITAGVIEAIQIYGSLVQGSQIQTAGPGTYPRIEFSSSNKLIKAERDGNSSVTLEPELLGNIGFYFKKIGLDAFVAMLSSNKFVVGTSIGDMEISSVGGNIDIFSSTKKVNFSSWSNIYNKGNGRTLEQELQSLSARITALGG